MTQGYDRYAQAVLCARIDPETGRDIRLRVDAADWQQQEIATALRHLTALPKKTGDGTGEVKIPLTWAMVTQASKLMEERGCGWKPDPDLIQWITAEFLRRHDPVGEQPFNMAALRHELKFNIDSLDWTPMPHQVAGAYVGALNKRFFFCDDMRTGKTRTALLTAAELEARGENPFPMFVVAPASVVDSWLEELDAAFPDWPVTAYRGSRRKNLSSRYKVYVMSWDVFRTDMKHEHGELPPLVKFLVPKTIVLDEAHALCNVKTKQSVAARQIARVADFAFLMSGTPITRDVGGFWSAINVVDIRSFPDPDRYKDRYTDRWHTDYGQDQVDGLSPDTKQEFYTLMQGSMRRIAKSDVNKDLPPKSYSTRVVHIPAAYRAAYDEMEQEMIAHIPDTDEPLEVMSTLAQLQRLTQLASSACDVEIVMELDEREDSPTFGQEIPRYHVTMREPSWKVDELMAILDENQGTGNPLLAFSPHTQLVNLAGKRAEAAGYRVGYITGEQSAPQKKRYRIAYQAGELDLLCCNVMAGGVGLTLNRGDTVVFLERPWAYWQANQAESRADNIIAAKQVHVIDIVATKTVESRVREKLKDKAAQLSELVRDPRIVQELLGGQQLRVLGRPCPLPFCYREGMRKILAVFAVACALLGLGVVSAASAQAATCTATVGNGCGPYTDPGIPMSTGYDTYVNNQNVGANTGTTGTLTANSAESWSVTENATPYGYGGVQLFPDTQQLTNDWCGNDWGACSADTPLNSLASLTVTYSESAPSDTNSIYEFAPDIWSDNYAQDVMFWGDTSPARCTGNGMGASNIVGQYVSNGQNWTVYRWSPSWPEIIIILDGTSSTDPVTTGTCAQQKSGTIDLKAGFNYLTSHSIIPGPEVVTQVNTGFEVTSADNTTFTLNSYSVGATIGSTPPPATGYVSLTNLLPFTLDDPNGSAANGTAAQVWSSTTGVKANQQFTVTPQPAGYDTISSAGHPNLCLDVSGYGTSDGTKVQFWSCNGGVDQEWAPQNGTLEAVNASNVRSKAIVLDDPNGGGNGTKLQIWQANGRAQQLWTVP